MKLTSIRVIDLFTFSEMALHDRAGVGDPLVEVLVLDILEEFLHALLLKLILTPLKEFLSDFDEVSNHLQSSDDFRPVACKVFGKQNPRRCCKRKLDYKQYNKSGTEVVVEKALQELKVTETNGLTSVQGMARTKQTPRGALARTQGKLAKFTKQLGLTRTRLGKGKGGACRPKQVLKVKLPICNVTTRAAVRSMRQGEPVTLVVLKPEGMNSSEQEDSGEKLLPAKESPAKLHKLLLSDDPLPGPSPDSLALPDKALEPNLLRLMVH